MITMSGLNMKSLQGLSAIKDPGFCGGMIYPPEESDNMQPLNDYLQEMPDGLDYDIVSMIQKSEDSNPPCTDKNLKFKNDIISLLADIESAL